jgi:hypothetical protein
MRVCSKRQTCPAVADWVSGDEVIKNESTGISKKALQEL